MSFHQEIPLCPQTVLIYESQSFFHSNCCGCAIGIAYELKSIILCACSTLGRDLRPITLPCPIRIWWLYAYDVQQALCRQLSFTALCILRPVHWLGDEPMTLRDESQGIPLCQWCWNLAVPNEATFCQSFWWNQIADGVLNLFWNKNTFIPHYKNGLSQPFLMCSIPV